MVELLKNIKAVDLGILIELNNKKNKNKKKILVLADIHVGYEEALNKQGVLIPRFQFKDTVDRISRILEKTKPDMIIINGDLKHEFGRISEQEWRDTLKLLLLFEKYTKNIVLIKGNHDTILGPIAEKKNIKLVNKIEFPELNLCITHGHRVIKIKMKNLIIGHEHPSISLREALKVEQYKCFLKGEFKDSVNKDTKTLIVQPSFNQVSAGTDVSKERLLSPYLKNPRLTKLEGFEVFIVGEMFEILDFGKIKKFSKALKRSDI